MGVYCHRVSPVYATSALTGSHRTDHPRSPLAVFQTVDQPAVVSGNYTAAGFNFAIAIFALILAYMRHQESKGLGSERQQDGIDFEEQSGETSGRETTPTVKIPASNVSAIS